MARPHCPACGQPMPARPRQRRSDTAARLVAALRRIARPDGVAHCYLGVLAADLGCSVPNVQGHLRRLNRDGLVRITDTGPGGTWLRLVEDRLAAVGLWEINAEDRSLARADLGEIGE